jgi:protein-tyrosine phosphatase
MTTKKVLFICTGNYYRSRYAELFFNHLALKMKLNWQAFSRGLAADQGLNVGPISTHTLKRLTSQNIPISEPIRFPLQLEERDLLEANLTIALDRHDHQPMMVNQFPSWADQITYWDVPDLNITNSETALSAVEQNVLALIDYIHSNP